MRHIAAELHLCASAVLLTLAVGAASCGDVRTEGLENGGNVTLPGGSDARPGQAADAREPDAAAISTPLPGAGPKSLATWTCSGGGAIKSEATYLGFQLGGVSRVNSVSAPDGSRITIGHFADTVE